MTTITIRKDSLKSFMRRTSI